MPPIKDGLLVLDRNGDQRVSGGHELFYDSQVNVAGVGLNVLKEIDSNYDFKINTTDYVYNYLQVWQDINQDAVNGASHLMASEVLQADATGYALFRHIKPQAVNTPMRLAA